MKKEFESKSFSNKTISKRDDNKSPEDNFKDGQKTGIKKMRFKKYKKNIS